MAEEEDDDLTLPHETKRTLPWRICGTKPHSQALQDEIEFIDEFRPDGWPPPASGYGYFQRLVADADPDATESIIKGVCYRCGAKAKKCDGHLCRKCLDQDRARILAEWPQDDREQYEDACNASHPLVRAAARKRKSLGAVWGRKPLKKAVHVPV